MSGQARRIPTAPKTMTSDSFDPDSALLGPLLQSIGHPDDVKKLEDEGYITGYSARIDEAKMGFGFNVFVSVKLDRQIEDRLVTFEAEIARCPEVVDCWLMTGSFDYLMRVAVFDMNEFERFLTTRLTRIGGVASIESSIPVRRVKNQAARLR